MVLKKGRANDDVLIIDASKGFTKEGKNNKLRARDIKKIADVYNGRIEVPNFSRRVSRALIRENEYNLNIPRYVDSSEKPEKFDVYATMFGGVPKAEIADMSEELSVFKNLQEELFTKSETPYVNVKTDDVKNVIEANAEVKSFASSYKSAFDGFESFLQKELIDNMEKVLVPREESVIAEEIFNRLSSIPLVDKYEAYQILDEKWQIISADLEMIQTEGKAAITQVDENIVIKKKDGKDVEVQDGWVGHILPFELVQKSYLEGKLADIKNEEDELSGIISQYEEIIDSIPEEDRGEFLNDDNTSFVPKEVAKIIKPFAKGKDKPEAGSVEETLIGVNALIEREKALKKEIKKAKAELHNQTKELIEGLSESDAISVLKSKWVEPIVKGILLLPDSIVSGLENRINTLTKKYSVTMIDIDTELEKSEQEFCALIDELEGNEFDMLGLKELQKMLRGGKND